MYHNPRYEADLHCHTSASDGLLMPGDLVEHAAKRGLKAIAVTDHDTLNGLIEAEKSAERLGILLIKGIEINTDWQGKEVHILGYGLDENNNMLKAQLLDLQEKRITRIKEILERLKKLGMNVSFTEVRQEAKGESIGRPHVAQALVKKGYAASFKGAFEQYLKRGCPTYVPRYKINPAKAIMIIRDAGGVPVLAHPGSQGIETEIQLWLEQGLQGIEVNHPDHSLRDIIKYRKIAQRKELIATGGSDYHGQEIKPGIDLGDWGVGLEIVEQIQHLINKK